MVKAHYIEPICYKEAIHLLSVVLELFFFFFFFLVVLEL